MCLCSSLTLNLGAVSLNYFSELREPYSFKPAQKFQLSLKKQKQKQTKRTHLGPTALKRKTNLSKSDSQANLNLQ